MFDINALIATLPILGKGMFGIFVVTAVIVVTISILLKVTNKAK